MIIDRIMTRDITSPWSIKKLATFNGAVSSTTQNTVNRANRTRSNLFRTSQVISPDILKLLLPLTEDNILPPDLWKLKSFDEKKQELILKNHQEGTELYNTTFKPFIKQGLDLLNKVDWVDKLKMSLEEIDSLQAKWTAIKQAKEANAQSQNGAISPLLTTPNGNTASVLDFTNGIKEEKIQEQKSLSPEAQEWENRMKELQNSWNWQKQDSSIDSSPAVLQNQDSSPSTTLQNPVIDSKIDLQTSPGNETLALGFADFKSKWDKDPNNPLNKNTQINGNSAATSPTTMTYGTASQALSAFGGIAGGLAGGTVGTIASTAADIGAKALSSTSKVDGKLNFDWGNFKSQAGDIGIGLASSMLGKSDNSVVRAGGVALGGAKNTIGWINNLKDFNAAKGNAQAIADLGGNLGKWSNIAGLGGTAASVLDTAIFGNKVPQEYAGKKGGITQGMDMAYDAIQSGIGIVPGIGTLVSGIMAGNKLLSHAMKSIGGGTDGMTTTDAILGSSLFGSTIGALNGFTGSTTTAWTKDRDIYDNIGGSYMGSNAFSDEVEPYAGKKFGGLSHGAYSKWNKKVNEAIRQENLLRNISDEQRRSSELAQTMTSINNIANLNKLSGGYSNYTTFAKHGAILEKIFGGNALDKAEIVIKTKTIIIKPQEIEEEIKEEPEKETIPTKVSPKLFSVIPEGALHARLHHMEDDENITKKGIPVIDNEGEQQAEIERNEIIFCLDATKKLEEYWHDGSDDSALKAGKLLVKEILEHTIDRTGLIDTLKKGGEIIFALDGTKTEEVIITPLELFNKFINGSDVPENLKEWDSNKYHMMRLWELYGKPSNFEEAIKNRMFESTGKYKKEYHAPTVGYNKETDEYEFLKSAKHPTVRKELDWYYSDDPEAVEFRNKYELDDSGYPWYKYTPKIKEFKEGGSINVIPEGALHARKNNMEGAGKDFTHKGIPVIDIDGEQQAEIELNEIIFRLEVTKKLEELSKREDKDKAALEAGKLLVDEILNNTDDRTGLIQNVL